MTKSDACWALRLAHRLSTLKAPEPDVQKYKFVNLLLAMALCLGVGYASARATSTQISGWYTSLAKPSYIPPDWVFPVAWTILYLMMAFSLWLLWQRSHNNQRAKIAISLFLIQLALNGIWPVVFFSLHQIFVALAVVLLLAFAILLTMVAAWPVSALAASLLIPYLGWVTYAAFLNAGILAYNH
jgi:translocator protein